MATVYEMMMRIGLHNEVSAGLLLIGNQLTNVHRLAERVTGAFGGWRTAILAAGSALTASLLFRGLEDVAKAGMGVNHQMEMMKQAGMSNAEIQRSMAQAMQTSGTVLTTTVTENLKHINELRTAFGDTTSALQHLDELSKANTILNSIKGGGQDQVWELVKSLEGKGLTYNPAEFSKYIDTMTKVTQVTGGKVTPEMFFQAFKYGRTATLGWSQEFVGGPLGRLIQEYSGGGASSGGASGGPGNALASAFAKIVQGQTSKTSAQEFERLGLGVAKHIKGSAQSQLSNVSGRDLFMANPYEWVQQVLMPALLKDAKSHHRNLTDNDIIQELSKLFQVRTASDIMAKMALQGRAREGEQSPFEKDIRLFGGGMGLPAYDELIKNDVPTILRAFNAQWDRLMQILGSDLMKPGGPVVSAMSSLLQVFAKLITMAGQHPEALKVVVLGLGGLAVALAGLATVSVIAACVALAPGGMIAVGIAAFIGIMGTLAFFNWERLKSMVEALSHVSGSIKVLSLVLSGAQALYTADWRTIAQAATQVFDIMKQMAVLPFQAVAAGLNTVQNALKSLIDWVAGAVDSIGKFLDLSRFLRHTNFESDPRARPGLMNANFNPAIPQRQVLQPIQMTLQMDGRTLAQAVSDVIQDLYTHPTGAPSANGWTAFRAADGNYTST